MAIVSSGLIYNVDAADPASYPGSGDKWYDLVSSGADQVYLRNGVSWNPGGWFNFGSGRYANAYKSPKWPQANVSICAWVRPSTLSGLHCIWTNGYIGQQPASYYSLYLDGGNWDCLAGGDPWNVGTTGIPSEAGKWYYAVVTGSGTGPVAVNFYINAAVQQARTSPQWNVGASGGSTISDPSTYSLEGDMAMLHVYDRALTAEEVAQNYAATKSRFTSMGIAYPYPTVTGGATTPAVPSHAPSPEVL